MQWKQKASPRKGDTRINNEVSILATMYRRRI
jgi:hypothetical protein